MNICYPYMWISNIVSTPEVQEKILFGAKESSDDEKEVIQQSLSETKLNIRTVQGKSKINVKDFLELKDGDVIQLDARTDSHLSVYAQRKRLFDAIIGIRNNRYAMRITSRSEGDK